MDEPVKAKRKRGQVYEDDYDIQPGPSQVGRVMRAVLRFGWRVVKTPFVWTWRLTRAVLRRGWGWTKNMIGWTWRGTKGIVGWTWHQTRTATGWAIRAPFRAIRWTFYFIFGKPDPPPQNRYEEIRQRVRRQYRRRRRFITHLFAYGLVNGGMWLYFLTYANRFYMPLRDYVIMTIIWSVVMIFHFVRLRMGDAEDRAIEDALERERQWEQQSAYDVERHLRLTDDGELIDYQPEQDKLRRN